MKGDTVYHTLGGSRMQKYNYSLDLTTQNSNSKIISHLQPDKEVLEFGPAFGRLTRYMKEELNCSVDIVEMDEESGTVAAKFARNKCIGITDGNIEKFFWENILAGQKYDYIIFADVLEHLHNPEETLKRCYAFLKDDGCILCSVPNIAHSSIIISLWNNDFTYNDVGLLDNTHVHFFTRPTFEKMANTAGYQVSAIEEVISHVGTNEIPWTYESVPKAIQNALKFRKEGNIYQYIYELKKNTNENYAKSQIRNINGIEGYECICFVREEGDTNFSENKCIRIKYLNLNAEIYFDLSGFSNVVGLYFILAPKNSLLRISKLIVDGNEEEYATNGTHWGNGVYAFDDEARVYANYKDKKISSICLQFELLLCEDIQLESINHVYQQLEKDLKNQEEAQLVLKCQKQADALEIEHLKQRCNQSDTIIKTKVEEIETLKNNVIQLDGRNDHLLEENEQLKQRESYLQEENSRLENMISEIRETHNRDAEQFKDQIDSIQKKHDQLIEEKQNMEHKIQSNAFSRYLWKHLMK